MTKNITANELVSKAIHEFLESELTENSRGHAVFGYLKEIPNEPVIRLMEKFDYAGHVLLSENAQNDLICEDEDGYETIDGLASVGGYAVDSFPKNLDVFKKFFNLFSITSGIIELSHDFLFIARITEDGPTVVSTICVSVERDETGVKVVTPYLGNDVAFDIFTAAARTGENGYSYSRQVV